MNTAQSISSLFQQLSSFRGKRRLCKVILDSLGFSKKQNIIIRTKSGTFELPNLVEIISFDLFVNGGYENGLVELLKNNIPTNGTFIDVGANIGSISIPLALARPDIKIVAIEASPWIFKVLKKNIQLNHVTNIRAENYAVYNESNKQLPMYAPKQLFGKGSLKPVYTTESETVNTITVDDIGNVFNLGRIDFVKVDVEGFEVCVFQGMANVIQSSKPKIIFEFSEWTEKSAGFEVGMAQSFLLSKGYKLQYLDYNFIPDAKQHSVLVEKDANLFAS